MGTSVLAASLRGRPPKFQGGRLPPGGQWEADAPPPLHRVPERCPAPAGGPPSGQAPLARRTLGFIPYAVRVSG